MSSENFITTIMSPGGGVHLIPFTRLIICCLFLTTSTVFLMGVARIHMFILSALSVGFYFALGVFQREYTKFLDGDSSSSKNVETVRNKGGENAKKSSSSTSSSRRNVLKAKRED